MGDTSGASTPRIRPRLRVRIYTAVVLILGLPLSLIALDSMWTAATSDDRSTEIVAVSPGYPDAETYDPTRATVFLNGLGRDISTDQAQALTPSVGQFGRVYALQYAPVFDPNEAADTVRETVGMPPGSGQVTHLTVVASSMGDVRGLELIASLSERHANAVTVVGFVVNTGPGPDKRIRVRGGPTVQALLDQSCSAFVPGRASLGLMEIVNQTLQGHVTDVDGAAIAYSAGTEYRGQVVVNQLCSLTRPSAIADPPFVPFSVYLATGFPLDDVIVDGEGAYADWLKVLPGMEIRRIEGTTHDNLSYRPDLFNPVFAEDLMPLIRNQQIARTRVERSLDGPGVRRPV
ncbi:MAG: hypothetical protein ACK5LS_05450 [Propioniciclava sp.]